MPRATYTPPSSPPSNISIKIMGIITPKNAYNLTSLANYYSLPDLQSLATDFMMSLYKSSPDAAPDSARVCDYPLEAYNTLQVPVRTFDNNGHILHRIRCTGPKLFRKQERHNNWVFVRHRPSSPDKIPDSLDGRVLVHLNAIFKLRDPRVNMSYHLAYVLLLKVIGSPTPDGPEEMACIGTPMKNHVIQITDI